MITVLPKSQPKKYIIFFSYLTIRIAASFRLIVLSKREETVFLALWELP